MTWLQRVIDGERKEKEEEEREGLVLAWLEEGRGGEGVREEGESGSDPKERRGIEGEGGREARVTLLHATKQRDEV